MNKELKACVCGHSDEESVNMKRFREGEKVGYGTIKRIERQIYDWQISLFSAENKEQKECFEGLIHQLKQELLEIAEWNQRV